MSGVGGGGSFAKVTRENYKKFTFGVLNNFNVYANVKPNEWERERECVLPDVQLPSRQN